MCSQLTNLYSFNHNKPYFTAHTQNWPQVNCPGFIEKRKCPQTLQIWTHWTITSGAPWWKNTINISRSLRRLMSWKSPVDRLVRAAIRTHQQGGGRQTSPSAWLRARLQWWSFRGSAVTLSVSIYPSPSLHPHLITNKPALKPALPEPPADYRGRQSSQLWWTWITWVKLRNCVNYRHVLQN